MKPAKRIHRDTRTNRRDRARPNRPPAVATRRVVRLGLTVAPLRVALVVLHTALFAGGGAALAQVAVTDDLGREVRLDLPAQHVVLVMPSHTETVCALDACDRLVGRDTFSNVPEPVLSLPDLGSARAAHRTPPRRATLGTGEVSMGAVSLLPAATEIVCAPSYGSLAHLAANLEVPAVVVNLEPPNLTDILTNVRTVANVLALPEKGETLLLRVSPSFHEVAKGVRHHHERWDGAGYPDGLAGEAIPRFGRILAIVDAFEVLTSDQPYRHGLREEDAAATIATEAGRHFDPAVSEAFPELWRAERLHAEGRHGQHPKPRRRAVFAPFILAPGPDAPRAP